MEHTRGADAVRVVTGFPKAASLGVTVPEGQLGSSLLRAWEPPVLGVQAKT